MCLIAWSWRHHPRFAFIVAANRDEFHNRPTEAADFWSRQPSLLAGRDQVAGGTWLGLTRAGRFAALTNFREPGAARGRRSRGLLVRDFLLDDQRPAQYVRQVARQADDYAGFNLLIGDWQSLYYYGNRGGGLRPVEPGIGGLSNAFLDTPWPKVRRLKATLAACRSEDQPQRLVARLMTALADTATAAVEDLPNTGVSAEREVQLSSPFVLGSEYGTRSSTVIVVDKQGNVLFSERSFGPMGARGELHTVEFSLSLDREVPSCRTDRYSQ